jgi:hypothetical protein
LLSRIWVAPRGATIETTGACDDGGGKEAPARPSALSGNQSQMVPGFYGAGRLPTITVNSPNSGTKN